MSMYADRNPQTKKALKELIAADDFPHIFQPNALFPQMITDGEYSVEGPHYPAPHRWYARVLVRNGLIVKVKA